MFGSSPAEYPGGADGASEDHQQTKSCLSQEGANPYHVPGRSHRHHAGLEYAAAAATGAGAVGVGGHREPGTDLTTTKLVSGMPVPLPPLHPS